VNGARLISLSCHADRWAFGGCSFNEGILYEWIGRHGLLDYDLRTLEWVKAESYSRASHEEYLALGRTDPLFPEERSDS
jgi:hypothetical protein